MKESDSKFFGLNNQSGEEKLKAVFARNKEFICVLSAFEMSVRLSSLNVEWVVWERRKRSR